MTYVASMLHGGAVTPCKSLKVLGSKRDIRDMKTATEAMAEKINYPLFT